MVATIGKGCDARDYITAIDETLFARHAFPLPRLGKISSNPAEQANSGLLSIREFALFKLLVELWYYLQQKFNLRRATALGTQDVFTEPALVRHEANLRTFGQWHVLDDGAVQAKVQTMDQR